MTVLNVIRVSLIAAALLLAGCPSQDPDEAEATCADCGVVEAVEPIRAGGKPSPAAAIAGAIIGGAVGHQFGGGNGKDAATVAGALGGAVVGAAVDSERRAQTRFEVRIAMDNGARRTLTLASPPEVAPGDRVRLVGESIRPRKG